MSGTASSASAGSDDEIRLRVETISGEVIQLVVSKRETVLKLKNRIFKKQGIPVAEQNLMFLEEELKDFHTLDEYNIIDSCTIKLSIGMKGGPINTRRTLYLDDKNTIQEMAKMLAAHDISVVLVPHNGAFHVIPVASDKRDGAQSSAERRHSIRRSAHSAELMEEQQLPHSSQQQAGSGGRRVEENKATKSKMVALQKQFKKKRSALGQIPALIPRQGGCCASNLQKSILSDAMPPLAAAPMALVAAGGAGGEAAEHQHKVVVPRLITSHPHISLNELNSSQTLTQFYTATTATADGGGAFESSSSYASGVERNVVFYPTAGTSGSGGSSSSGGDAIFVSPYKGLFRCTADTTENASKEDVSSGSGRCSSAAAAPPPADNSPTVVERPQSVNQSPTSTTSAPGSAGASSTSGQLNGARGQLLSSQATPSTPLQSQTVDDTAATAAAAAPANKDEVKVEHRVEDEVPEPEVTVQEAKETSTATPPKKKHPRCLVCNKKTGLASSYTCRCGGNFCATHRYAEAHNCGHDYKTEGRQQLERSNPLIQAAKLQKI
ncbi:AN1-type zinc finger protein 4 [Galendromus occidentalis]|uniref:AN1-type zinc finger protein 4 n=1 Tax=Galendromus occidentalis TaxID=34638 RepID=A0AAJ6QVD9_9ACAR|nr:AN1-type zinc finger protein 4 [Galendromus occidentalis]